MSESQAINPLHRAPLLAKRFVEDYDEAIKGYGLPMQLEITEHLLTVLDLIEEYAKSEDESVYQRFATLSEDLLKKHRKNLQPFWQKQFHIYFAFDTVLVEKRVLDTETFNGLTGEQQRLSEDEISNFIKMCRNVLGNGRHFILLRMEPEYAVTSQQAAANDTATADEPDDEITRARQMQALYYFLKAVFAIEHRVTHPISDVVRFLHLMTGTKFTTLRNSELYKKYQQIPNLNKDERLIKDLQFIRPYFEELQIKPALDMIDAEISKCIRELPYSLRKKYRKTD